MAELPEAYLVHVVEAATRTGNGAYGPVHADPVPIRCVVDERRKLVRAADGNEVVSEATLYTLRQHLHIFEPESLVTLPTGRTASVISVADRSDGGQFGVWQHLEVTLT